MIGKLLDWFEDKTAELNNRIDNLFNRQGLIDISEPVDYESLTKLELEELGRSHGIELDRRKKKSTLIEEVKKVRGDTK